MRILIGLLIATVATITICFNTLNLQADMGVGIVPGKIRVDESLMPGGRYQLPSIQVVNTGSQPSNYELALARMEKQDELQPSEAFFSFNPKSFNLEPGENQVISTNLIIPIKADPGNYLAYIEAHPVSQSSGGTTIGVAAATKLYFTVRPASTWAGMLYYSISFLRRNMPYSYVIPTVIILGLLVFYLRRRIKLEVKMTRK